MTSLQALTEQLNDQAVAGNVNNVSDLLRRGANINGRNGDGWTPLLAAASMGLVPIVRELLKDNRLYVNEILRRPLGVAALTLASLRGHAEVVREMVRCPWVDVNAKGHGRTSLMVASSAGHAEVVRELLLREDLNSNAKGPYGNTALMVASANGQLTVVCALLLLCKVDANAKNYSGDTALSLASKGGQAAVVHELLLHHNRVDVNTKNNNGDSALLLASSYGHGTAVRECPRGRDQSEEEHAGFILEKVHWREAVVLELLKDVRVDVNVKDMKGRVAFSWASYHNNLDLIHAFLKHKEVDVNATGAHGNTPLMWACFRGQADLVVELLQHVTVDLHAKNKAGSTALDIAIELDMDEIVGHLSHMPFYLSSTEKCVLEKNKWRMI